MRIMAGCAVQTKFPTVYWRFSMAGNTIARQVLESALEVAIHTIDFLV